MPIFAAEQKTSINSWQPQKGILNLTQIQHQNGHGDYMVYGFMQLCSDQSHAAFALCQTESALCFYSFAFIPVILCFVSDFAFLGATKRRSREPNAMCFAITEILAVAVDFVCQNPTWIMLFALPEAFHSFIASL